MISMSQQSEKNDGPADPFEDIAKNILTALKEKGGRANLSELERWAELSDVGKYTLRTVVNELIARNMLRAPEGFYDAESDIEPPIPKVVVLPRFSPSDLEKLKEYLREYHSVGILRLFEDLSRGGIKEVNEVLKEAVESGYAELSPTGVVNATSKLISDLAYQKKLA